MCPRELMQEQCKQLAGSCALLAQGLTCAECHTVLKALPLPAAKLVCTGVALLYYFGPDADQEWAWITPGAIAATVLWIVVSLLFKVYVARFTDDNAAYGTVGGVIIVLLWFYVSGLAVLIGAELNAEIEHASPDGKDPGQKRATP